MRRPGQRRELLVLASQDPVFRTARWDCVAGFFQSYGDCEMYMEEPPAFVEGDGRCTVYRLLKSVYGTKQVSRLFFQLVRSTTQVSSSSRLNFQVTTTIREPGAFKRNTSMVMPLANRIRLSNARISQHNAPTPLPFLEGCTPTLPHCSSYLCPLALTSSDWLPKEKWHFFTFFSFVCYHDL
jgi:hypothetical protein